MPSEGCMAYEVYVKNTPDGLWEALQRYLFPFQFALGIVGNVLNLFILLSLRAKPNIFLSCVAISDICFLVALLPGSLNDSGAYSGNTKYMYMQLKNHFVGLANWFSTASIWFVLTVTTERLIGIRFPLNAKLFWRKKRIILIIIAISTGSFVLTFFHHVSYKLEIFPVCNHSEPFYIHILATNSTFTNSTAGYTYLEAYIYASTVLSFIFIVVGPLILLVVLNLLLIFSLRKQHHSLLVAADGAAGHTSRLQSSERKVSIMVIAIVTSFTITNTPSCVLFMWHYVNHFKPMNRVFYYCAIVSNSLVVTGKVLNFFLYCIASAHFRRQLVAIFRGKRLALSEWLHGHTSVIIKSDTAKRYSRGAARGSVDVTIDRNTGLASHLRQAYSQANTMQPTRRQTFDVSHASTMLQKAKKHQSAAKQNHCRSANMLNAMTQEDSASSSPAANHLRTVTVTINQKDQPGSADV